MNFLNVFVKPRYAVEDAFLHPSVPLGVLFVVLASVMTVGIAVYAGSTEIDYGIFLFSTVREIILWAVSGLVLFELLMVIKGKSERYSLSGVLYSLSLLRLPAIAFFLIGFVGVNAVYPNFMDQVRSIDFSTQQTFLDAVSGLQTTSDSTAWTLFGISAVLCVLLAALMVYFHYTIISYTKQDLVLKNLVILILNLVLTGFIAWAFLSF
ncbi:MAG: hypothetical protein HY917_02430 [Candidatus Diapherotrites archaeon]|nr:hypothetical protein [Candidatus Diapherotrites archaeon]